MNFLVQFLILISTLTLWMPALAQGGDGNEPPPVVLSDDQSEYALGQHMEILDDPAGKLTFQDVSSSDYSDKFIASQVEAPTFGYSSDTYWVRFKLRNQSHMSDHWLLEVVFANLQYVDLYLPSPAGEGYIVRQTGMLRPFSTRDIANHHIVFDIPLPFEAEQTFYMRFQSGSSMTLPLTLWFPRTFFQASTQEQLFLGMFYGVFLIMLIYYLFLLYLLRESIYLYYICFLASGILLFSSYDAITSQYLWPNWYTFNLYAVPVFFILFLASIVMFSDAFLETRNRNPKLHRLAMLVMAGWGICLLLVPFTSYHFIFNLIAPYGVVSLGLATAVGLISWRGGYRPARFFLLSWIGLIVGGILLLLVRLGFIPSTPFTEQLVRPGIIWLMAFWAVALADRINLLKADREKANIETRASEERFRKLVETMNEGLGIADEEDRYTFVNESLAKMHGRSADEIIGHLAREFVTDENKQILTSQLERRKSGTTTPYELTWRRSDGSDRFVIVSPVPVFESDRHFKGTIAVITDITERVQASRLLEERVAERTRELQDARTQINTLFNNSPLGIAIVTPEGDILAANRAMQALTGFPEDELVGKNIRTLYAQPEQRESVLDQLGAENSLSNFSLQLRRKDGSIFHANLNLNRLEMAGQPVLLGIVEDITDQVEAREAITILHQLSYDLITITDLKTLIDQSVPHLHEIIDFQLAALMLVEEGENSLTIYGYSSPTLPPEFIVSRVPVDCWPSLHTIMLGRVTSYVPNMQASEVIQSELDGIKLKQWAALLKTSRSWVSLPLLAGDRTIGLLNLFNDQVNYFDAGDLELARTFTNQLAVAIDNIYLNEQTRQTAAAGERSRIARELHDSVTQTLFSASVLAEATPRLWDKDRDIARKNMEKLGKLIRGALAEMRSLLIELRSDSKTDQSLAQLLNTLVEGARARSNMTIDMTVEGDLDPPPEVTMAFYRIAQEALNNVIKHAVAARVEITLERTPSHVELDVKDDGHGFELDTVSPGHMGISIMAERAKKIGGDFQIQSRVGQGTEIKVNWTESEG